MPSMTARDEIEIEASPQTVFDMVSDYDNIHLWMDNYHCEVLGGAPLKEGGKVSHKIGKAVSFVRRIDKIIPGERLEETYLEGDILGQGVWAFEPTDKGTRISFTCAVKSNSLFLHIGFLLTGNKAHKSVYQKALKKLKANCEALPR